MLKVYRLADQCDLQVRLLVGPCRWLMGRIRGLLSCWKGHVRACRWCVGACCWWTCLPFHTRVPHDVALLH